MTEMEVDDEAEAIIHHKNLVDAVFSWSFEDVLNKDLYKDKVQQIPLEFQSIPSYMRAFVLPLIEETHADLSSSIDTVSNASTYSIMSIEAEKEEIEYDEPCRETKYTIEIETTEIENDVSREPEMGDLIAITDVRPKCVEDLNRPTMPYCIALIQKVTNEKDYIKLRILSSKPILLEQGNKIIRENNTLFAVFLMNILTNIRIWTALNLVPKERNLKIIEKVLQPDSTSKERCSQCLKNGTYYASKGQVLASTRSMDLNESQQEAIEKCFAMKYCRHESTAKLIWGPPGTGKTKTICALLFALLSQKCRTITCCPTNVSIVEVALRLLRLVMESLDPHSYGYGLGDVVLFGNRKRMKFNDESELIHVFLDHRVIVLKRCFAPSSGWTHLLDSLVCLIQDSEQQYQLYLMNGQEEDVAAEFDHGEYSDEDNFIPYGCDGAKDKGFKSDESNRIWQETIAKTLKLSRKESRIARRGVQAKKSVPKDWNLPRSIFRLNFEEFLIKKFNCKAKAMKFCIVNILSHLPTSLLSMGVAKDMTKALKSLGNLHSLLNSYTAAGSSLREVLVKRRGEQRNASGFTELELVKDECLQILKSLPRRFFDNVGEFSIREKILENSCLLFCTVSSSIKLHSTEVELLVIDEAAQLKECESTIPLQIPGLCHAMLFGDDQQLPALVKSEICKEIGFGRSLFQRLASLGCKKHLLNLQYRMHPSISLFPNKVFYQNQILDAPNVKSEIYQKHFLQGDMYGTYSFIDVRCGNEEVINGHKYRNMVEVAVVCEVVANLFQECAMLRQKLTVGIISPYAAQVDAIKENLGTTYSTDGDNNFSVDVRSVDGFQGGEKDIIIISTVRSNGSGSVGFLTSSQRANVALTRARYALWIFGNGATLRNRNSVWRQVLNDAKSRQCFYDACEDKNLAKAMAASLVDVDILDIRIYLESQLFKKAIWQVSIHENFWKSMARISSIDVRKKAISLLMKLSDDRLMPQHNQGSPPSVYEIDGLVYILATFDTIKEASDHTGIIKVLDIRPLTDPLLQLCGRFAGLSLKG
ncbi:uncharacterized protein LOC116014483 isoform X1 [Ipomoea triloba]|uniref:uncharacterized protein LOC116014483 isoform X1 n=2 Tax=Ipomoea triloba TaxID=35885 RepID=UPI00125E747E|nr:uncharacterized protein LOC116014483 isoform X1 [Ipomoea triloba]